MKKKELLQIVDRQNEIIENLASLLDASEKTEKRTEKHMQIAENEIKRLNVIIHYLEQRNDETFNVV